jgi:DNA polymerase
VADLSSIETRVGAYIAQCAPLLKVFEDGRDAYLDFGTKMTGIPYDKLVADIKSKDPKIRALAKRIRQMAKPGVLGAIYRLSGGGWGYDKNGDRIKTGLWGYAEAMGIYLTQEEAHEIVKIFRESYREIPETWMAFEDCIFDVLKGERTVRYVGPNNCIKIFKTSIEGRDPILVMELPSGHRLHYMDASIQTVKMPWQRNNPDTGELEDVYRPGFCYYGMDQNTHIWTAIVSHGGKTFEQATQALSRDALVEGMLAADNAGISIVIHAHDEIGGEVINDPFSPGFFELENMMGRNISYLPGLPLKAEGWEGAFYHK